MSQIYPMHSIQYEGRVQALKVRQLSGKMVIGAELRFCKNFSELSQFFRLENVLDKNIRQVDIFRNNLIERILTHSLRASGRLSKLNYPNWLCTPVNL